MTTESIPMGEAFNWGWTKFKENAPLLVAVQLVALLVPSFVQHFGSSMASNDFMKFVINVAAFIVGATVELGLIKIALRILDDKPVEFANLFDSFDRVGWYSVARFLAMVGFAIGFVFFIVPGFIIWLRLWFIGFVTIDEHPVGLDSLQRSMDLTRGFTVDLFLFGILLVGVNIVGVLCLGVGLLVSLPVSILARAYVFRQLAARGNAGTAQPPPGPAVG